MKVDQINYGNTSDKVHLNFIRSLSQISLLCCERDKTAWQKAVLHLAGLLQPAFPGYLVTEIQNTHCCAETQVTEAHIS